MSVCQLADRASASWPIRRIASPAPLDGRHGGLLAWAAVKRLLPAGAAVLAAATLAAPAPAVVLSQGGVRMGADVLWSQRRPRPGPDGRDPRRGLRRPRPLDRARRAAAAATSSPIQQLRPGRAALDGRTEIGVPTQHGVRMAEIVHDIAPAGPPGAGRLPHHEQFERGRGLDRRPGHPDRQPLQLVPDAALRRHRAGRRGRSTRPPPRACSGSTRPATTPSATGAGTPRRRPARHPDRARRPATPLLFSLAWSSPAVAGERSRWSAPTAAGAWARCSAATPAAARPSAVTTAAQSPTAGAYRLVVRQEAGPAEPTRPLLADRRLRRRWPSPEGSIPTPGDAARRPDRGRGQVDRRPRWSPTPRRGRPPDGRVKPDLVGPTYVTSNPEWPGTAGTSAATRPRRGRRRPAAPAAPARGACPSRPPTCGPRCSGGVLDLGPPGPDPVYGAGMARLDTAAPRLSAARSGAGARPVVRVRALDDGTIRLVRVTLNGRAPARRCGGRRSGVRLPALAARPPTAW